MTTKWTSRSCGDGETEERAAGVVLFRQDHGVRRYLLLRHRGEEYWAFPKGRVDPGERDEDAAVREVREETGIERVRYLPGVRLESRYEFHRNDRSVKKTVIFYVGETSEANVVLSDEHVEALWLGYPEAAARLTYGESRRVLQEAERQLKVEPGCREVNDDGGCG